MRALLATILLSPALVYTAAADPVPKRAIAAERAAFIEKHRTETIAGRFSGELNAETEVEWLGAFWAAALIQERTPLVRDALARALASWDDRGEEFRRALLQCVYTLFPNDFGAELDALLPRIDNAKQFAMAAEYLVKTGADREPIAQMAREKFSEDDPIVAALLHRLDVPPEESVAARPPLAEILSHEFLPGEVIVYTFARVDRSQPAVTVLRDGHGRFYREGGRIFSIPHLAMSVSNMPGYLTNGNGAQGLYSIRGTGTSTNVFIGPTPFLWTRLPVEASPSDFLHREDAPAEWSEELYRQLLPNAWQDYTPIHEAWYAGAAGRSEIILHGTTINPEFYAGAPYYPNTPSLGCITATELWSPVDGRLLHSDQRGLLNAWGAIGAETGFYLLVELDAAQRPVLLEDVLMELLAAEDIAAR